jgi:hypothetical protein
MEKKVFFWVFGLGLALGTVLGLVNLIAPDAVSVTLNEENVEGMAGLWTAMFSGAIPGLFFGLIGAGIAALFARKKKSE